MIFPPRFKKKELLHRKGFFPTMLNFFRKFNKYFLKCKKLFKTQKKTGKRNKNLIALLHFLI